jgi:hypothetical protein
MRRSLTTGPLLAGAVALALAAVLPALRPRVAAAQTTTKCEEESDSEPGKQKKNYRTVIGPDGRKVFVIEKAFVVCGKVPKPNVIYVLQASTINYEWETLKQDFLPKILNSVKRAPF